MQCELDSKGSKTNTNSCLLEELHFKKFLKSTLLIFYLQIFHNWKFYTAR